MATSYQIKSLPGSAVHSENKQATEIMTTAGARQRHRWSPYNVNGGTAMAVAGKDFCIVAGDTRMSDGYSIMTRENSRLTKLTGKCVISSGGMQADYKTLHKVLQARIVMYKHKMKKDMNTISVSQLLSNTLYGRRFFPYYAFNVVGGVDEEGVGAAFGYDAVGSFERVPYAVTGSGSALITSLLDNQVAFKTQPGNFRDLSVEETLDLVKDCFTCAGERDIYTGDKVQICIITKDGIKEEVLELKRD